MNNILNFYENRNNVNIENMNNDIKYLNMHIEIKRSFLK